MKDGKNPTPYFLVTLADLWLFYISELDKNVLQNQERIKSNSAVDFFFLVYVMPEKQKFRLFREKIRSESIWVGPI